MDVVCNFSYKTEKVADKSIKVEEFQLRIENQCLKQEVAKLNKSLDEYENKVEALEVQFSSFQGNFNAFKGSTQKSYEQHTLAHTEMVEYQNELLSSSVSLYENFAIYLSIFIAISGALSFVLLNRYKKREIQEVVDKAVNGAKDKLKNDDLLISAVVNSFDDNRVKGQIEDIKRDILSEQEFYIRSIVEDTINDEDRNSLTSILETDEDNDN